MKIQMVNVSSNETGRDDLSNVSPDISFTNGQSVLIPLTGKAYDPAFIELFESGRISRPKTDGARIYWIDGPSLSCAEILQLVRGTRNEQTENCKRGSE